MGCCVPFRGTVSPFLSCRSFNTGGAGRPRLNGVRASVRHKDEGEFRTTPIIDPSTIDVPVHTVTVHDRTTGAVHQVQVPEDQYILHTAEYQNVNLPFSCRHGCCTACAVRVKSGEIYQPQALGISPGLKAQGYALLCVGYPLSDIEVETQDEDEVYWLQFGQYFAGGPVERDDYALELAVADE